MKAPTVTDALEGQLRTAKEKLYNAASSENLTAYLPLAKEMLEDQTAEDLVAAALKLFVKEPDEKPVTISEESHSDQGWHYQHKTWVKTLKQNKIFQSMSRKATCADNAAMENFFGLLKQEMYYGEELIAYEALKKKIVQYIDYYNNERIKQKLAGMSPVKYRIHTSQLAA